MTIHEILLNLLIGICAGIISGVIVSRIFFISDSIERQIEQLRTIRNYLNELKFHFSAIEIVLKQINDTSDEIKNEIRSDPTYLKTHDIIDADMLIENMKLNLIDKTIDKTISLLNTNSISLKNTKQLMFKTHEFLSNIKRISKFKFSSTDSSIKQLDELTKEYTDVIIYKNRKVFLHILKDWVFISIEILIFVLIVLLCIIR